jgi:hypothetical protein
MSLQAGMTSITRFVLFFLLGVWGYAQSIATIEGQVTDLFVPAVRTVNVIRLMHFALVVRRTTIGLQRLPPIYARRRDSHVYDADDRRGDSLYGRRA